MTNSKNDLWPGKVTIDNEEFNIYEGRLSFTPKEDFYLVNLWIKSEDCESKNDVFPPMIEIRVKTKVDLPKTNSLKLEVPKEEEVDEEWHANYYTHYYDGMHQYFTDANIEISRVEDDLYAVEFSGSPEMYRSVKGNCKLHLKDELMMYW